MRDNSKLGCFGVIAICVALAFLWIAVLYVGIPLAIVGGSIAAYLFKHRDDPALDEDARNTRSGIAIVLAGASLLLGGISLAGNIFTDSGPFGHPAASTADATTNMQFAEDKVTVTPAECTELKAVPQTRQAIKGACYRMFPTNGWGDSAGRLACESDQRARLKACGVELYTPPF